MSNKRLRIGDIFEINLKDNRKAFGQYIYLDKYGPLITVFNIIVLAGKEVNIEEVLLSGKKFPPIYTGVLGAIKSGYWKIVGHAPVENFVFPIFVSTLQRPGTGEATKWFSWDGKETKEIGQILPQEFHDKEFLAIYSPDLVVERIENGEKPYSDLIRKNKLLN